jgi:hypothetical protein
MMRFLADQNPSMKNMKKGQQVITKDYRHKTGINRLVNSCFRLNGRGRL